MERIQKFIEDYEFGQGQNTYWLAQYADALRVYCCLINSYWDKPDVKAVANWEGDKTNEYYTLLDRVLVVLNGVWSNTGSNYGWEKQRSFTAWAIQRIKQQKFNSLTESKKAKLIELESEKKRIEMELAELIADPSGKDGKYER